MANSGGRSPRSRGSSRKSAQASVDSEPPGASPIRTGAAGGGDAPGGQDRLGAGAGVHAEVRAVQEQVVQLDALEAAGGPGGELVFDRLADPRDRRLRQCGFRAERISQRGFDIAHAQPAHEPGND
jgi:hypothetical protein